MRYTYKDIFDLRDYANIILEKSLKTHKIICNPKFEFVDVYWQNISNSEEILLLENASRDEFHKWLAGFITALEIKETKVVDKENSWWSKYVRPFKDWKNVK